jgi:hypothetical protein
MKKAKEIFKSFPNEFVANFTGTCLCNVEHPEFGKHKLTPQQVKNSSGEYKNEIYKNICEQIDLEVEGINSGLYGNVKDEPLVKTPFIKLLYNKDIDGIHELNSWIKYPELMEIAVKLSNEDIPFKDLAQRVQKEVRYVESKMPYRAQFVWEELGKIMGFEPA